MKTYELWVTSVEDGAWRKAIFKAADITWNEGGPLFLWAEKWGDSGNEAIAGFAPGHWSHFRVVPTGETEGSTQ